jgi:hypothetical protein
VVEKKLKKIFHGDKPAQKRAFEALVAAEHGNLSFGEGLITGCEKHCLRKAIAVDGAAHEIEMLKCKGYSQKDKPLNYSDFELLEAGGRFSQKQMMQLRCPKSNYVSETDAFTMHTQFVKKSFKTIYSKSGVNPLTGIVTPHET